MSQQPRQVQQLGGGGQGAQGRYWAGSLEARPPPDGCAGVVAVASPGGTDLQLPTAHDSAGRELTPAAHQRCSKVASSQWMSARSSVLFSSACRALEAAHYPPQLTSLLGDFERGAVFGLERWYVPWMPQIPHSTSAAGRQHPSTGSSLHVMSPKLFAALRALYAATFDSALWCSTRRQAARRCVMCAAAGKAPEASYAMRAHRTAREGVCRAGHRRQAFGSCISAEACAPISQVEPAKPVAVMLGVPAGGPIVDGAPPAVGSAGSTREAAGMPVRAPWSPQSAACVLVSGDRRSLDKGLSRVAVLLPAVHVGWGGQGMHGLASWRPGSRLRLLASCAAREQKADDSGKEGCNLAAVQTERRAGHCPPHQPVSVQPDAAAAVYDESVISHPPRVSPPPDEEV
ncbi:hypothetical protein ACCO45_006022 [Purpureocillium lilacinum]|uniref:Uncharacterized protein n=1 Tax=Purpureocillium lilacinum TaxID=33203 RepID=A0ACC4DZV4_PURLI